MVEDILSDLSVAVPLAELNSAWLVRKRHLDAVRRLVAGYDDLLEKVVDLEAERNHAVKDRDDIESKWRSVSAAYNQVFTEKRQTEDLLVQQTTEAENLRVQLASMDAKLKAQNELMDKWSQDDQELEDKLAAAKAVIEDLNKEHDALAESSKTLVGNATQWHTDLVLERIKNDELRISNGKMLSEIIECKLHFIDRLKDIDDLIAKTIHGVTNGSYSTRLDAGQASREEAVQS